MKKVLLGLVALSAVSMATTGGSYLNIRAGGDLGATYSVSKEEGVTWLNDETDGFGGELALEGYISIDDNLNLGLGLAYQYHADRDTQNVNDDGDKFKTSGVEYKSIPVYLITKYNFDTHSEFKPYLKANLGYSFNFDPSDYEEEGLSKDEVNVYDGLYWALGGGLEYNNFTLDLMYALTYAESKEKDTDMDKVDNDYGRVVLSVGYRFNL